MNKPLSQDLDDTSTNDESFLSGNSEMASLISAIDWSGSPLGPIEAWSQSLRTTVSLCLASNFPINIIWGPEHIQIYNDGYRIVCGDKHPEALGMDYKECWASAWPAIGKPFEDALKGVTSFLENQRMFLFRNGYLEETFFTFSLSPIRVEAGDIGGLFHPVTETTATMIGERRTRAVRDLTARLASAESTSEVFHLAIETLAHFNLDLPFVLLYQFDEDARVYRRVGRTGIEEDTPLAPAALAPDDTGIWPMEQLFRNDGAVQLTGLRAHLKGIPCGPYEEAPDAAFGMPIRRPGKAMPVALLMAGASPRLPLNDIYRGFYDLVAAALSAALTRVTSTEEERRRLEMLAAIDRAKTVFFSNVSHEFRTPLTLMLGPLEEALQEKALSSVQLERLQIANRNAQRLLKLVNSLLDFSRIEAGRADASFVPTNLPALTEELASNFRSACLQAGLDLVVDCPPLSEPVYIDREMWEKILLNLLSNAFKFTLSGSIKVTLRERDNLAELVVSDTGVGIPAQELPRVFERFHRVEGQRGRSAEGTGIGLSMVRELVQLHRGTIEVASQEGKGTTFVLRLPFGKNHLPAEQVHAGSDTMMNRGRAQVFVEEALRWIPGHPPLGHSAESTPGHPSAGDRPRIVLADDNADMRIYVERILSERGYQVEAVSNGAEALAAVRKGPLPELVLSDVMMPEMDGFELLRAVRADAATRDVVLMLLSARAGEEARLEGLAAGADDYMVKPFSARELTARIDGAVALARQRREAAAREQALHSEIELERGRSALRESEAHVTSLFEQTAAGIVEVDLSWRIIRANDRYCRIIGYDRDQVVGKALYDLIHPEDLDENVELLQRMLDTGQPFTIENRYLRSDGTEAWVSKAVTPIHVNNSDKPQSVLAVVLDIADRKKAEEEQREANRRKDEFLAMLAHELRNPLAPISAAAELMGLVRLDEARLKQTSEVIMRQVRHMTSLVDDLLDVSRVTRGLVTINRAPQEVNTIVTHAIEQVRPLVEARGHRLLIDLAPESGHVLGDEKRLVQTLTNLLNNAAKYTPERGRIQLRTEVHDDWIEFNVQDNGIGIAPELQTRVFDLFAQAERTPDRSQGGLGLGLALVKNLVELHGGKVSCSSDGLGKGSCFTVSLPRYMKNGHGAEHWHEDPHRQVASERLLRILVVDDNADAAQMLMLLLQSAGHTVTVEHSASRALEHAQAEPPDVCILDVGLPEMDGNELARRLRSHAKTSRTKLVALTGYGKDADRQASIDAGFDNYLVKPVDTPQLFNILAGIGDSRREP